MMENKVESPDNQMDISEAGTTTADNISTSSASPTISNLAENENTSRGKSQGIDSIVETVRSIQLTTRDAKNYDRENMENRNTLTLDTSHQQHSTQKLTPVHHHPLMFDDDNEPELCHSPNLRNFPDVVIDHQPLRLTQPSSKKLTSADFASSVNNNGAKARKAIYREPSPVSPLNLSCPMNLVEVPANSSRLRAK